MASPDPNRFASRAEAGYLRGGLAAGRVLEASLAEQLTRSATALHDADRAVADAQETRASVKENYDTILRMHAEVARSNLAKSGLLHPIRGLPDEVLSEIFLAYLVAEAALHPDNSDEQWHHLCHVPNTVAWVSKRWRSIACDTPRLWRYISVVFLEDFDAMRGPWIAGLQARIARSGSVPVNLLIRGPFPWYDDEGSWATSLERGAHPPWTRGLWEPLITLVPRCKAIHVVFCTTNVDLTDISPLLRGDAPLMEDLAICLPPVGESEAFFDENIGDSSPHLNLNVRAPNLRRIQLAGVLPGALDARYAFVYPRLEHATITMNSDFTAEHAHGLLLRFPALTRLELGNIRHPARGLSLAWFAHPSVQHLALDWISQRNDVAGPETFPCLESADFVRAGHVWDLEGLFSPAGPFHALNNLTLQVDYYEAELVRALDMLPRLQSAVLSAGVLTRAFVALDNWRGAAWRCSTLEHLILDEVEEVQPIEPDSILAWLRERNSSARGGKHKAFRRFSIEWKTRPESFSADFDELISRSLKLL